MRERLTQALYRLEELERADDRPTPLRRLDSRAKLAVTLLYLVAMLSVPLTRLSELLLFVLYPVVMAAVGGFRYGSILRRSLVLLPFVAFIGLFNIFQAREPLFRIGPIIISVGWTTFQQGDTPLPVVPGSASSLSIKYQNIAGYLILMYEA